MAIDTRAKRLSAIATRRLPWFRRFQPEADGSMTQADRQQIAFVYRGIGAEAEIFDHSISLSWTQPTAESLSWTQPDDHDLSYTRSN